MQMAVPAEQVGMSTGVSNFSIKENVFHQVSLAVGSARGAGPLVYPILVWVGFG